MSSAGQKAKVLKMVEIFIKGNIFQNISALGICSIILLAESDLSWIG
jgi:hypothetical protein